MAEIASWALQSAVMGGGTVGFFAFRHVLGLIKTNKKEDDESRKELKNEMKDLRMELHTRVNNSETKLLAAIEQLPKMLVSTAHCDGKQEVWTERFANFTKTIETALKVRAKADTLAHDNIENKVDIMAEDMSETKKCMSKLAKKENC